MSDSFDFFPDVMLKFLNVKVYGMKTKNESNNSISIQLHMILCSKIYYLEIPRQ